MTVVDSNVLIYAANRSARYHEEAKRWFDCAQDRGETLGLSWSVFGAFIRLTTRAGILPKPISVEQACGVVAQWIKRPDVRVLEETEGHLEQMCRLLGAAGTGGNLTTDAHLAALALSYGAALVSFDRDFGRFPGLRWVNPASLD